MRTSESKNIEKFLIEHRGFAECIIEEFLLTDYGTTFEVAINYIWDTTGELRSNIDEPQTIVLRFRLVQELRINNALTEQMLRHPQDINWGLNEIAGIKIVSNAVEAGSEHSFIHLAFVWEGDRRIEVIFSEFEVFQ
jgi:hypothetical protein